MASRLISAPSVSARSLKECRLPSTRTLVREATSSANSSSVRGRSSSAARYAMLPAQLELGCKLSMDASLAVVSQPTG